MDERWRQIVDYEGLYDISDFGRVRSARKSTNTFVGRMLRPGEHSLGYHQVILYKDGVQRHHYIHRLVASVFIGECNDGEQVNHIDGNKKNNRLDNLEYVTPSENSLHAFSIGKSSQVGERNSCAKLTEDKVLEVMSLLGTMPQWKIGKLFGVNQSVISRISTGGAWACVKEEEADNVEQ